MLGPEREVPRAADRPSRARVEDGEGLLLPAGGERERFAKPGVKDGRVGRRVDWHQRPVHVLRGFVEVVLVRGGQWLDVHAAASERRCEPLPHGSRVALWASYPACLPVGWLRLRRAGWRGRGTPPRRFVLPARRGAPRLRGGAPPGRLPPGASRAPRSVASRGGRARAAGSLGRLGVRRGRPELLRPADVMEQRRNAEQVASETRVELGELAADRRHADRVLEQAARVGVVRRRQSPGTVGTPAEPLGLRRSRARSPATQGG